MKNTQTSMIKQCTKCKHSKPSDDFYTSKGKTGTRCKTCLNAYARDHYVKNRKTHLKRSKAWQREHHDQRRRVTTNQRLVRKYNITVDDKVRLIEAQDTKCAICKHQLNLEQTYNVTVDHCHVHGHVRGILCRNCNCMIGLAKDNIVTLRNAISYLEKSSHSLQ